MVKYFQEIHPVWQIFDVYLRFQISRLYQHSLIVINIENKDTDPNNVEILKFYKDLHAWQILLTKATKATAAKLAQKLILTAERLYQFHSAMGLAGFLVSHVYALEKDKRKGKKYRELYEKYKRDLNDIKYDN